MAISSQLVETSEYDGIVGRTEGLEPARVAGRALVRGKPPLEFQTAMPEFPDSKTEDIVEMFNQKADIRAVPIPIMPAAIDITEINDKDQLLAVGLGDNDLQTVYIDLAATPFLMVSGDTMTGKSTILTSWIKVLKEAEIYAIDSNSMGLYSVMGLPNVINLLESEDSLLDDIKQMLDDRRQQMIEYKRSNKNLNELVRSWKQVVFVIDRLSEFTNGDQYLLKDLLERIVKQERGLKVAVIAADNTIDLTNNWDSLGKAIRDEQTGILLGSLRDQGLFAARFPYGAPEKEFEFGDGYLIVKNKYTGIRCATMKNDLSHVD